MIGYTDSPVTGTTTATTGRPMTRKRKCVVQSKRLDESDDLEIYVIEDSGSSGPDCLSDASSENLPLPQGQQVQAVHRVKCQQRGGPRPGDVSGGSGRSGRRVLGANGNFRNTCRASNEMSSPTLSSGPVSISSPLPFLEWADKEEVWQLMTLKDESYRREPLLLTRHPVLQARMRAILLDWLNEVTDVYKLHRETFYLAIDFVDRFLSAEQDVPKQELQLIGITCLFIAAKIEEIYPPKLSEFSYVTDGACEDEDILNKELVILKSLNWDLTPMTVNAWLSVYLQLYAGMQKENAGDQHQPDPDLLISLHHNNHNNSNNHNHILTPTAHSHVRDFMLPGYASHFFEQVSQLLDLCILDIGSLSFNYSVLAAAALYHFSSEEKVYQCTGLRMHQIRECVMWMTSAAMALREHGFEDAKSIRIKQ